MAYGKRSRDGINVCLALLIFIFMSSILSVLMTESVVHAAKYSRRSHDTAKSHKLRQGTEPVRKRQISVSKIGVARLKKSSFWNKRPFQFSTPVFSDSTIFVGVDAGLFYAIDAKNLKKKWEYVTEGPVQAPAIVNENIVYFGDYDGVAYALNAQNGSQVWKTSLNAPVLAAPLILGGRIYFVTDDGKLMALELETGQITMQTDAVEKPVGFTVKRSSTPVFSNGLIIFGTSAGVLLAYKQDGSLVWVKQLGDRRSLVYDVDSTPLIVGNSLYITSADEKLFNLNATNGSVTWVTDEIGGVNDVLISDNRLYVTGAGILAALDAQNGNPIWKEDFETPGISSPAIDDDIIAVVSTEDKFYLVDANTGDVLFERFVKKGSFGDPIFVNNNLYILSNSGRLFAFHIRKKSI